MQQNFSMEFIQLTDEENNKYSYKRYQGYAFNKNTVGNVRDQLQKISQMNCNQDDVLIAVFPKSGIHWMHNTVKMLRSGNLNYSGTPVLMEHHDFSDVERINTPRTFGTHLRFRFLPEEMKNGTGKVVTITRNPKDLAVSMYKMILSMGDIGYTGTFQGFLNRFVSEECFLGNGSWFAWMKDMQIWTSSNLLCLSYEDFKQNTYANIVKLAKFLEVNHSEEFLKSVEESIGFEKLKQSHNDTTPPHERWINIAEDGRLPIYRKGQIGEWKNTFTVAKNEWFEKICKEKMEEFGLTLDLVYE